MNTTKFVYFHILNENIIFVKYTMTKFYIGTVNSKFSNGETYYSGDLETTQRFHFISAIKVINFIKSIKTSVTLPSYYTE